MPESTAGAGDRLLRAGLIITAAGMALTLIAMLPLAFDVELPSAFWWLAMLTGLGLAMVIVGLARNARRRSRSQIAARATLN